MLQTPQSLDDNNYVHSLPPFANEANKQLSKRIKDLEAQLNSASATGDDNKARADAIIAHMKNVKSEAKHTQALYDAKQRQIETEEHFQQLADRENGRLKLEIKRIDVDRNNLSDYVFLI
jgi:UDP-glucose:O-linked fucose beta-1,3-glucosyltransferase